METDHSPPWGSASGPVERSAAEQPSLPEGQVDVAVVGAGIVGLSTALALTERGADVIVLEAGAVGDGVTAHSTAKISALHETAFSKIARSVGDEAARSFAALNLSGLRRIEGWATEHGIECSLETCAAVTYAEEAENVSKIEDEVEAARAAGLDAEFVTSTELPYEVAGAVRLEGQARFDPLAFLRGAAAELERRGCPVHEQRRVVSMAQRPGHAELALEDGADVRAGSVVIATHYPFTDRALLFPRLIPARSYGIAAPVAAAKAPVDMYLGLDLGTRSIRSFERGSESVLILGGEGHAVARSDERDRFATLERFWAERFGTETIRWRWSAQDPSTPDGLPFIGRVVPWSWRAMVASGFAKWGIAAGAGAGELIAAALADGEEQPMQPFSTSRLNPRASLPKLSEAGLKFSRGLVADRIVARADRDKLAPGDGAIVGEGLEQHAVYRDADGTDHVLSARCTHMGCIVRWNGAERSWDCPCHGSRFGIDGSVIEGPAVHPLESRGQTLRTENATHLVKQGSDPT